MLIDKKDSKTISIDFGLCQPTDRKFKTIVALPLEPLTIITHRAKCIIILEATIVELSGLQIQPIKLKIPEQEDGLDSVKGLEWPSQSPDPREMLWT